jgi:YggT family protein
MAVGQFAMMLFDAIRAIRPKRRRFTLPNGGIQLLDNLLNIYSFVLLARILLSWVPNVSRSNQIVDLLYRITDPVLEPVRRAIPPMGSMDLSPLIVFIGIRFLRSFLLRL